MADEPEEGFTVRDRRRVHTEPAAAAPPQPAPAPEPAVGTTASAAEEAQPGSLYDEAGDAYAASDADAYGPGGMPEEFTLPDIYSVLFEFLQVVRSHAYLRMGLVANPSTGQIERDLEQARIAIDTAAFLVGKLESVVAPEDRLPLKAMLSDLQMNYVEQAQRGG